MSRFFDEDIEAQVFHRFLIEKDPFVRAQLTQVLSALIRRPKPNADVRLLDAMVAKIKAGGPPTDAALKLMETTANAYLFFLAAFEAETEPGARQRLAQQVIRYRAYPPAMEELY